MLILITGGSGSGKSAFAEDISVKLRAKSPGSGLYYLATMKRDGHEALRRIERHKGLRQGKGFETIECPVDVGCVASHMEEGAVVLLESLSDLMANELFDNRYFTLDTLKEKRTRGIETAQKVYRNICVLYESCRDLIIVTDDVYRDGAVYGEDTDIYMEALASVEKRLAEGADEVHEVCAGYDAGIVSGTEPGIMSGTEHGMLSGTETEGEDMKGASDLILIIGGAYSGKRDHVRSKYIPLGYDVIWDLNEWIRERFESRSGDGDSDIQGISGELDELVRARRRLVIISRETGSGIVPIDKVERQLRELTGRIQIHAAQRADAVIRMMCGIPVRIK